ncbi:MAG TPA: cytochrome c oxidase subunit 3 [Polyangia bacterium]|jgi:cytochrome c oxidase subunit 3
MPAPSRAEQYSGYPRQEETLRLGMWIFLASESLLFAGLFALYAAYRAMYAADFAQAIRHNTLVYGTVNTYVLLTSSLTVALSVWAVRRGRPRVAVALLLATAALGGAFLVVKGLEYAEHLREGALPGPFYHWATLPTFGANRFFTLYWLMTGLHALHVMAGLVVVLWLAGRAHRRRYTASHHTTLEMGTLYWHLVDVMWLFLWPILYLA